MRTVREWMTRHPHTLSPEDTLGDAVEMMLVMPKEISGQEGSRVLTSGWVARSTPPHGKHPARMAVTIRDYRFLHQ